jgi:hypothetical protein
MKKIIALAAGVVLTLAGISAPAQAATPPHHAIPQKPIVGVAGYQGGPVASKDAYKALMSQQKAALITCGGGSTLHWQGAAQSISTVTNGGATSIAVLASQHKPFVDTTCSSGAHSLWELNVSDQSGDQTIEVGWTKDKSASVCGTTSTTICLFIFSWVNGVPQGYNAANPGWVDNPNETSVNAGTALASTASGAAPTAFYQYRIERVSSPAWCTSPCSSFGTGWQIIQKNQGASDRIIGGFKDTVWSGATPAVTFTAEDYMQIYGEQADLNQNSCSDSGSGVFGTSTEPSAAARVVAYSMVGAPAGTVNQPDYTYVKDSAGVGADSPTAYRLYQLPADHDQWKWGGPGYNAAGTGTGSIAAC